jgi:ParB-like chromosome segregation protein Spo0J
MGEHRMSVDKIRRLAEPLLTDGTLEERVEALNEIRRVIHELSPFVGEPVDIIEWVPGDEVEGNTYNPNSVAPPEMELLRLSIAADGYTQPIVTNQEEDVRIVVDGFHRTRVGKECDDVRERVHGYLPVVQIRADRTDNADRMASTIRHNRARGKHQVVAMSDIVVELKRRNWSDARIGKELGMDPDEVLRLCQITGLAEVFKDREFSAAWEHTGAVEEISDPDGPDGDVRIDLEWMNDVARTERPVGWDDRTENSSVLRGDGGTQLGAIQRSRFEDDVWFWYAYTKPMTEGRTVSKDDAKLKVEAAHWSLV